MIEPDPDSVRPVLSPFPALASVEVGRLFHLSPAGRYSDILTIAAAEVWLQAQMLPKSQRYDTHREGVLQEEQARFLQCVHDWLRVRPQSTRAWDAGEIWQA